MSDEQTFFEAKEFASVGKESKLLVTGGFQKNAANKNRFSWPTSGCPKQVCFSWPLRKGKGASAVVGVFLASHGNARFSAEIAGE